MLCTVLVSLTLLFEVEGRSEMRQVRKGGKSGREAISRVEKSTTERYRNRADPSSVTEATGGRRCSGQWPEQMTRAYLIFTYFFNALSSGWLEQLQNMPF